MWSLCHTQREYIFQRQILLFKRVFAILEEKNMLIFGHPWIKSATFKKIFSLEALEDIKDNQIALMEPLSDSAKIAQYCQENEIEYAISISSIKEAILANALRCSYLIAQPEDAIEIQPIAQEYLFDSKVVALIENEKDIEKMARHSIDGVVFNEAITA